MYLPNECLSDSWRNWNEYHSQKSILVLRNCISWSTWHWSKVGSSHGRNALFTFFLDSTSLSKSLLFFSKMFNFSSKPPIFSINVLFFFKIRCFFQVYLFFRDSYLNLVVVISDQKWSYFDLLNMVTTSALQFLCDTSHYSFFFAAKKAKKKRKFSGKCAKKRKFWGNFRFLEI